jgi:hypothetical protein
MPVRTKANHSALLLFAAVIAGFFTAGFLVPWELPSGEKSPLPFFMFMMGGIFLLINLALLVRGFYLNRRRAYIEQNWLTAPGEILKVSETGTYINKQPKIRFSIRVEPPGSEPRVIDHVQLIPLTALQEFPVGKNIMVKVDPEDHSRILLF